MEPLLERLGEFAVDMQRRTLAPEVIHDAKRAVIDWYAAALPGALMAPATLLERALADEIGHGEAQLLLGARATPRAAALINGTAAHAAEFDDIFKDAIYHPGAPTVPAALAMAQVTGASGEELLRAVIAAYEISTRIGVAMGREHYRYWHNTGTIGCFGATVAAGVLLGLDRMQHAHALATVTTFAAALQQAFRMDSHSKPLHSGRAAEAGVLAARAAREGIIGSLDVIDGAAGFGVAMSNGPDWGKAMATLGREWNVTKMTVKNHGCCGHAFAAIDGALEVQSRLGAKPEEIESVRIGAYKATLEVANIREPRSHQEAQFSTPYLVAHALVHGSVRLDAFGADRMADPRVRALMPRVSLALDPERDAAFPGQRSAVVTVALKDGRSATYLQPARKGDPELRLSDAELEAKYTELATPVIGAAAASDLVGRLWYLEALPDLAFTRSLRRA